MNIDGSSKCREAKLTADSGVETGHIITVSTVLKDFSEAREVKRRVVEII